MNGWILPTLVYVVLLGGLGVTAIYALRGLGWQQLVMWTAAAYVTVSIILIATGARIHLPGGLPGWMTVVSAFIPPVCIVALYIALSRGPATKVIPVSSAYPFITVFLAAAVLSEALTWKVFIGTVLIVAGAVLVSI
jgi:transporter family protein